MLVLVLGVGWDVKVHATACHGNRLCISQWQPASGSQTPPRMGSLDPRSESSAAIAVAQRNGTVSGHCRSLNTLKAHVIEEQLPDGSSLFSRIYLHYTLRICV